MARIKVGGFVINADPVKQTPGGDYLMRSRDHSGRTSPGTMVLVKASEIIEMAAAEAPADESAPLNSAGSLSELETAMAAEREKLPTPASLIAQHREDTGVKTPPGRPTQPRMTGPATRPKSPPPKQWGQRP